MPDHPLSHRSCCTSAVSYHHSVSLNSMELVVSFFSCGTDAVIGAVAVAVVAAVVVATERGPGLHLLAVARRPDEIPYSSCSHS